MIRRMGGVWPGLACWAWCLLTVGCSRSVDLETARAFEQAAEQLNQASAPEQFLNAAATLESIVASGVESGVVYYNLGNAYLSSGRRGEAIAAYRRAQRYRPADPYLLANLEQALAGAGSVQAERSWYHHVLFWQDWLSYPDKAQWLVWLAGLTFLLWAVQLWVRHAALKTTGVIGLIISIALAVSFVVDVLRHEHTLDGVVTAEVTARKGFADSFEPAFNEPLTEGTEFELLERQQQWLRIRIRGTLDGWIPGNKAVVR